MVAHAPRILLGHRLNPIVRQPQKSVTHKVHVEAQPVSCHPQFLQRGAATGEIATRHQGEDPLNLPRTQRDPIPPFLFDRHPGIARGLFPLGQSDRGGIPRELPMFEGQEDDVILSLLIFSKLGEGLAERTWIEIHHERPQDGAVRVQADDLPLERTTHLMETVDDIDI